MESVYGFFQGVLSLKNTSFEPRYILILPETAQVSKRVIFRRLSISDKVKWQTVFFFTGTWTQAPGTFPSLRIVDRSSFGPCWDVRWGQQTETWFLWYDLCQWWVGKKISSLVGATELYLIYLEVVLSNKRPSKKHGGFGCCWRQIGGESKWVVEVQTPWYIT